MEAGALSQWVFCAVAAALGLGLVLPILWFRLPAMADYPNHLARIHALLSLKHDPLLARYYAADWRILPNLAFDGIMLALARAFGLFAAGKIFLVGTVLLLPAGTVALHRALHRRWSVWPLAAALFAYDQNLAYGLLNYLFGTGLALVAAALWIWRREAAWWRRALVSYLF
ncbi:MAG: hypothetical protein ACREFQ_06925, partial [Stellaceae bacterium]